MRGGRRARLALWGVGLALLVAPAQASASAEIGPERIVVRGPGAQATIDRRPLRLSFADGSGRTVLHQVPNAGGQPFAVAPAPFPVPLGTQPPKAPTLYSPLTFTVGTQANVQYPAGQFVGNQLAGTEAGVQYSARDVTEAHSSGEGVQLTVSTSDPSGRTLTVTVTPGPSGALRVSVRPSSKDGVATMSDSFGSAAGEAFRGFGGRHNSIDQRGSDFFNWIQQQNVGSGSLGPITETTPNSGGDRYLFPNGPHAAYYVRSDFVSSRGYGFLLDRTELSRWRLASDRGDAWQVGVAAPALDYVVAPGDAAGSIRTLTGIGGRQRVPPDWALGPQLDRAVKYPAEQPADYRATVYRDLRDIRRYGLPLDAYRIEGWGFFSRTELRQVIARLRSMGIKPLLYFRPFVGKDEIGTDSPRYYDEAVSRGYVAKTATGQPYIFVSNFNAAAALIDFTNPEAVRWWQGRIREALELGAEGFMEDFGEQVLLDMHFADGETGATMHNKYSNLVHQATRQEVDSFERSHPGRHVFFFTRSGYSGTPGAAASENANFPGDETTDWSRSSGLASQTTDMLNRSVGGLFGFGTDIGGYFDIGPFQPTTKELFIRWAELAALSPVFRLHGSVAAGTHTPWSFDSQTVDLYNRISRLRLRARPLIKRLWQEGARSGTPPTRPLWLAYPGDAQAARQDQEWMLGPDVLVAPVVAQGASSRQVYFPAGCWQHPETEQVVRGPRSSTVSAPLDTLPYFFRCGTNPFATRGACLSRRSPIGPRNIGRVRIGYSRRQALRRIAPQPVRGTRGTYRWCVKRSMGRVVAVFGGGPRRALLVASTASGHGNRRVRPGQQLGRLRRAYPRRRRVLRGVYRANPHSPRLIVVRRGRVRAWAVASRPLLRDRKALERVLRRARLR